MSDFDSETGPPNPIELDREKISTMLPQSGDFLLPDHATIHPNRESVVGSMEIRRGVGYTNGHFNILPGVIQAEFAQQVAALLLAVKHPDLVGLAGEIEIRIGAPFVVGETISARVQVIREEIKTKEREGRDQKLGGTALLHAIVYKQSDTGAEPSQKTEVIMRPTIVTRRMFERMLRRAQPDPE